jgi:hypothetical protein
VITFINNTYIPVHGFTNTPFFSSKLNKAVTLREPIFKGEAVIRTIEHKIKNTKALTLPEISLIDLSPLFLYCFNADKKAFSTFFTLTEAYQKLFPINTFELIANNKTFTGSYAYIRNRINENVPVLSENGSLFYLAKIQIGTIQNLDKIQ